MFFTLIKMNIHPIIVEKPEMKDIKKQIKVLFTYYHQLIIFKKNTNYF